MAASLNLSQARVTTPQGELETASVVVRLNRIRVASRRDTLAERDGVVAVTKGERNQWTVTFEDGEIWTVRRIRNCGCGGQSRI